MSVDPIILEFRAETARLKKQIDGLDKEVNTLKKDSKSATDTMDKGFDKTSRTVKKTDGTVGKLNKTFNTLASRIVAAFAVERIISFTGEAIKLAGELQGVEAAFNRIGSPALLQGLRDATRGTVSDLELMKNAVQASNFDIPLTELASLFDFARRRAKETGESVDFLVQSIVTGIGRKSPLILDNLGISATALKNRLGDVGIQTAEVGQIAEIVGAIASEEMEKMGDEAVTTADRIQQINAKFENFKVSVGQVAIPAFESLFDVIDRIALRFDQIAIEGFFLDAVDPEATRNFNALNKEADKLVQTLKEDLSSAVDEDIPKVISNFNKQFRTSVQLSDEFKNLSQEYQVILEQRVSGEANAAILLRDQRDYTAEMKETQDAIRESLEERGFFEKENLDNTIKGVKEKLKELKAELEIANTQQHRNVVLGQIEAQQNILKTMLGESLETEKKITKEKEKQSRLVELMIFKETEDDAIESEDAAAERAARNLVGLEQSTNDLIADLTAQKLDMDRQEMDSERQKTEFYREQQLARFQAAQGFFGALTQLAALSGERNKEFAIFEATINAALAITRAFADGGIADPITRAIYVASVTTQTLAQIAAIKAQPVPSFYEGTDFVSDSPSKGRRRDDVAARLHYGEAVITAEANKRNKGLSRALNKGKENDWIHSHHVLPALMAQKKDFEKQQKRDFATAITQSMALNMPDDRIVREVKRSRLVQQAILEAYKTTGKQNPYRA
jgi:hypothetical protein